MTQQRLRTSAKPTWSRKKLLKKDSENVELGSNKLLTMTTHGKSSSLHLSKNITEEEKHSTHISKVETNPVSSTTSSSARGNDATSISRTESTARPSTTGSFESNEGWNPYR